MQAVTINSHWCKGCGICVAFCPRQSIGLEKEKAVYNGKGCIVCGHCELVCPDLAISVDLSQKPKRAGKEESV
ncbi:MAG: 4Fe-4S binding protein [Desulfovibrio sp.]|nr:4Fe-4S binding protein [Desulfovibrio sp.]